MKGLDEIKRHYPDVEVFSMPCAEASSLLAKTRHLAGKINKAEFEGKAPTTLLYISPEVDTAKSVAKLWFLYLRKGWNQDRPNDPYELADFGPMVSLKAHEGANKKPQEPLGTTIKCTPRLTLCAPGEEEEFTRQRTARSSN